MVESPAPDPRPSPLPGGPPSRLPDRAQDDRPPSLRRTIIESTACLVLAALCFVGVPAFGLTTIEGWHLEHPAIRGLVTQIGPCEDNGDLDIECPARFTSLDGHVVDRLVTLNTWRSDPPEPIPARLAAAGYTHTWVDDATQHPSTRGGLIGLVIFSAMTALFAAPAVLAINTYRRGRRSLGGSQAG